MGSSEGNVGEDVVAERKLADNEEELVPPASVAAGDVEDDGDQTPDVLDCHRLRVKIDNGRGFVEQQGLMEIARIRRGDAVGVPVGVLIGGGEGGVALALGAREQRRRRAPWPPPRLRPRPRRRGLGQPRAPPGAAPWPRQRR